MNVQVSRRSVSAWRGLVGQPIALNLFRLILAVVLLGAVALFIVTTWRWPLVGDAPLFHYVVSLLRLGYAPYRDIVDINLPGTYAVQAAVIDLLGPGPRAFRVFDLSLLAAIAAAMFVFCRANAQGGRRVTAAFPALFAATLFAVIHGRDGVSHQGQRDLVLATLYLAACAFLMVTLQYNSGTALARRFGLWPSLLCGLLLGFACAIKPSAVLFILPVLAILVIELRSQQRPWLGPLAVCTATTLFAPLMTLIYLVQQHALVPFWQTLTQLMPYHASLRRLSLPILIFGSVSSVFLPLFLIWLAVFLLQRRYTRLLDRLLLIGFLAGIASYILQGRGYSYHRYPSEVFFLLLAAIAFCDTLWPAQGVRPASPWVRIAAVAGLCLGTLFLVPRSLQLILRFDPRDQFTADLRASLEARGGPALDRRIQCLDESSGCLNTLQQMHLVESTGFLYDCYLYDVPEPTTARFLGERARYRQAFQQALLEHPPQFLIVSSFECGGATDYAYLKLARWPWLQHHLDTQYHLVEDHIPSDLVRLGGKPAPPIGFRIYRSSR